MGVQQIPSISAGSVLRVRCSGRVRRFFKRSRLVRSLDSELGPHECSSEVVLQGVLTPRSPTHSPVPSSSVLPSTTR
jgi:hypothetical protein